MTEEGLFSESASKDWAGSVVKLLKEQTKKTKQKSELQRMTTEQKKVEQSKQSTLKNEINNAVDVMLVLTPKYYRFGD